MRHQRLTLPLLHSGPLPLPHAGEGLLLLLLPPPRLLLPPAGEGWGEGTFGHRFTKGDVSHPHPLACAHTLSRPGRGSFPSPRLCPSPLAGEDWGEGTFGHRFTKGDVS